MNSALQARLDNAEPWQSSLPVFDVTDAVGVQSELVYDDPTEATYVQITVGPGDDNANIDWNSVGVQWVYLGLDEATELASSILRQVVEARNA